MTRSARTRALSALILVGVLALGLPAVPAAANHQAVIRGYIPVAVGTPDETTLHYRVSLPDKEKFGPGPYPTVIDYSGYLPAITIYDGLDHRFLDAGYAVAGVNMRGSGCSGGKFDYFEPLQARDGADAVQWLATQPWSNGRIGMVGKSYPGITQLYVAAQQPSALKAIVPGHVFGDLYRDVPYPGGILNVTFASYWSAARVMEGYVNGPDWYRQTGDEQCLRNQQGHAANLAFNPFVQALYNQYDGPLFQERSAFWFADRITAPTMLVESWQDEQVGSRATHLLERLRPGLPWRFVASNGDHGEYYGEEMIPHILRFLDYHLRQVVPAADRTAHGDDFDAAFAAYLGEPPVHINWENGAKGGRKAAWAEQYSAWPPAETKAWRLYLQPDGTMSGQPHTPAEPQTKLDALNARLAGAVDYRYVPVVGSQARGEQALAGQTLARWRDRPADGTYAAFETAALPDDKVLLGTASVDLYIASTAVDTDFQVTLSEVRPDGQEMFVQQGWLRASHRLEESRFSTELRPFQSHRLGDSAPLIPGHPTKVRIEVFPFGHVFRAGSKVRISVEAPHALPDLWGFTAIPAPAVNTIFTSSLFPSSVALPLIDGGAAKAPLPPCTLRNQPCRAEP